MDRLTENPLAKQKRLRRLNAPEQICVDDSDKEVRETYLF